MASGTKGQRGPPRRRALAGQRGPGPGQRGCAARTGRYPVTGQVASCRGRVGIGHGDRRVQAIAQVRPGQQEGVPQFSPAMMVSPVVIVPGAPRTRLARMQAAAPGSTVSRDVAPEAPGSGSG